MFATSYLDLGCCNISNFVIKTTTEEPIQMPTYRLTQKELKALKKEIRRLLEAGIIVPSKSDWVFPIIMVEKADGSFRLCVDYRKLNQITIGDQFPIPRIDDILEKVCNARYYALFDLKTGYWQVVLDLQSRQKTAFRTSDGLFEFTRLPFGVKNGPREFSRIMFKILGDLEFVCIYFDDIIVFSNRLMSI